MFINLHVCGDGSICTFHPLDAEKYTILEFNNKLK